MYSFTDITPKHRDNAPDYANYTQYRSILKKDFRRRCAYCCDLDKYRVRSFAIDHYVPRNPINFKTTIPSNRFSNLIYACSYCNRAKWNKWPTDNESIDNDGKIGFMNPTSDNYKLLFFRNAFGSIVPVEGNVLAKYIYDELLLWLPIHSLMWRIEKLFSLEEKVKAKLALVANDELKELHYRILQETTDVAKKIFNSNA